MTVKTEDATIVISGDADVQEIEGESHTIADLARGLVIVDDATNTMALDGLSRARRAVKQVEELRHRFVDPLNAQVKAINDYFRQMSAPAAEADGILAGKTSAWRALQQQAARAEQARLSALAVAPRPAGSGPAPFLAPMLAVPPKTMQTASGSVVGFREVAHFEIVDAMEVPADYWQIDEKKLGAAVRAGVRTIPGVRIWTTEEPAVRA